MRLFRVCNLCLAVIPCIGSHLRVKGSLDRLVLGLVLVWSAIRWPKSRPELPILRQLWDTLLVWR